MSILLHHSKCNEHDKKDNIVRHETFKKLLKAKCVRQGLKNSHGISALKAPPPSPRQTENFISRQGGIPPAFED